MFIILIFILIIAKTFDKMRKTSHNSLQASCNARRDTPQSVRDVRKRQRVYTNNINKLTTTEFRKSKYYSEVKYASENSNVVEAHAQTVQEMILTQDGKSWKQYHINVLEHFKTTIEFKNKILRCACVAFLTNQSINEFNSDCRRIKSINAGSIAKFSESRAVFSASRRAEINAERDPNNILSAYFLGVKLLESTGNFVGISNLDILQLLGHFRDFASVSRRI